MKYIKIKTPQGELIYVPEEKHLYTRHGKSKKKEIWTCYQKTISKRKVSNIIVTSYLTYGFNYVFYSKDNTNFKCFARFNINADGKGLREYGQHSSHQNHEIHYEDIIRRNRINGDIDLMLKISPESAHTINPRHLFNRHKAE